MNAPARSEQGHRPLLGEATEPAAVEVEDAGGASGSVPGVPDPATSPADRPGGAVR